MFARWFARPSDSARLERIERKTDALMATAQELIVALGEANEVTNEIAADIASLMQRSEVPDDVRDAATALVARLRGVAASYPATAPAAA